MSFMKSLKQLFGFSDDEQVNDGLLADDSGAAEADAAKIDLEAEPEAVPDAPELDPKAVQSIFTSVVEVFNDSMPAFVRESVDVEAQKEFLYNSLEQSTRDYLVRLIDAARTYAEKSMQRSNHETLAEVVRLRQEKHNLEQQRSSIKEQQLSADRRRRALQDRVQDLEGQVASLEAEREQFELENKSLLNKLKLSDIQPAVVEELNAEIESLRARLASMQTSSPQPAAESPADPETEKRMLEAEKSASEAQSRLKESEARIAELQEIISAREKAAEEAGTMSKDMLNSLQHEMIEERRKNFEAAEALRKDLEAARAEIVDKDAQLEEATRLLNGMEKLSAQLGQVETVINKRDERIKALQAKNKELKQRLEKAERRLSTPYGPTLPFGGDEDNMVSEPDETGMISTRPISSEDMPDDFHGVDWLTSTPPKGTVIASRLTDEEFGYQEPPRKPRPKDADSQLSLF